MTEAKQWVWEKFEEAMEKDFQSAQVFLEDHPAPQEGVTGNHPSCVQLGWDSVELN